MFRTYGAPEKFYSDGGLAFVSQETEAFFHNWGVDHVVSSAHYPQSNGRAELAVKTAKRLISNHISPGGSLHNDAVTRAMLQYRNTPIKGLGLSPAQVLFHRNLRDGLPMRPVLLRPHKQWVIAAANRENALRQQHSAGTSRYNTFTKDLRPLSVGDKVIVQDHRGKRRWTLTGVIVEHCNRRYTIRMDGSARIIVRNRKFIKPASSCTDDVVDLPLLLSSPVTASTSTNEGNTSSHSSHDKNLSLTEPPSVVDVEPSSDIADNSDITSNEPVTENGANSNARSNRIPKMLRELQDYNNPGLTE